MIDRMMTKTSSNTTRPQFHGLGQGLGAGGQAPKTLLLGEIEGFPKCRVGFEQFRFSKYPGIWFPGRGNQDYCFFATYLIHTLTAVKL